MAQLKPLAKRQVLPRAQRGIAPRGENTAASRVIGALTRAGLVALMLAIPSLILPATSLDTVQIVALVCLASTAFTVVEYNCRLPSLIEFRDAPPFNRIRFIGLSATVLSLTLIARGASDPTALTLAVAQIGAALSTLIDIPFSPVRLMVLMFPTDADPAFINTVRTAAGLSYLVSMIALGGFVLLLRFERWPRQQGGFNVWTNLPMFDPTAGGDVVQRLERDGQLNLILGFLLPFLIPTIVKLASDAFDPIRLQDPHTLIWTMTAWAFIPASMIMRGLAMLRVGRMIQHQREQEFLAALRDDSPLD